MIKFKVLKKSLFNSGSPTPTNLNFGYIKKKKISQFDLEIKTCNAVLRPKLELNVNFDV